MFSKLLFLVGIFTVATSQTSHITTSLPRQPVNDVRIVKTIFRHLIGKELVTDSLGFEYDTKGNLTAIVHLSDKTIIQQFGYVDNKVESILFLDSAGKASNSQKNKVSENRNGDEIVVDMSFTSAHKWKDTVQLTYGYNKGIFNTLNTYVNTRDGRSVSSKNLYSYDSEGKIISFQRVGGQKDTVTLCSIKKWDEYNNPLTKMSKYNFIILVRYFPFASQSVHNPVSYLDMAGETKTIEMTYSKEGFPITYKLEGDDFIGFEFVYE